MRSTAIRFADLWAVDPHQMVDEIYSPDSEMENMASPARLVLGAEQLHDVEDRLSVMIPEHRHELVRVIVAGDVACLETTIVAPLSHEYAPACVWWWLDGDGKVSAETGWFDWADRSQEPARSHGTVPETRRMTVEPAAYRAIADEYAHGWTNDPAGSALQMFASGCTFGRVGVDEASGIDALRTSRGEIAAAVPRRSMVVDSVVGEDSCLALLVTVGTSTDVTRGTVVLTLGDGDLVISERTYLDWNRAVPRHSIGPRPWVGTARWTSTH